MSIYDFTVKTQDGSEISMNEYRGKVLLIVNTATGCGFTPQYSELQELYDAHHGDGLEILDFPCNQFGAQAPGSDEEIHTFCTARFGIRFPQFSKIDVNGENASDLYRYLTANTRFEGFHGPAAPVLEPIVQKMDPDYQNNGSIKWNFTKFLADRQGNIVKRFEPTEKMEEVKKQTEALL